MSDFDDFYSHSAPRTARGGIKAQSTRGAFAKSWWARRWIGVLEGFDIGARLGRGRSYARHGQVLSIDIQEGLVKASVQGSRATPYQVEIGVKTIPAEEWLKLSRTAFSQAITAAKLLASEMPDDIERLFTAHGVALFPEQYDDLKTECSCPDWSNPCKHIAAVYYLLGEEFDRDPFLVFRLRGMNKKKLLELIAAAAESDQSAAKNKQKKKSRSKQGESTREIQAEAPPFEELPVDARSFWTVALPDEDPIGSAKIPFIQASLPKRLGNLPFWRSGDNLMQTLEDIYKRASERAAAYLTPAD